MKILKYKKMNEKQLNVETVKHLFCGFHHLHAMEEAPFCTSFWVLFYNIEISLHNR